MDVLDLKNINLYELFDLTPDSSESEIKKAYRKKALLHHPDKNPDNPKANEIFQKLSKALEILTDKKAKESYDKILNARKEREIRNRKFDAKRRKLKDELEAKEKFNQEISVLEEEEKLKKEIERIRKEGSKKLEEENFLLKKKLDQQRNENSKSSSTNTVKVKLKRSKRSDIEITEDFIRNKFSRFGPILSIVRVKKSTLIEYGDYDSLKKLAVNCPSEFEFEIIDVNKNMSCSNKSETTTTTKKKEIPNHEPALPTVEKNDDDDYEDYIMRRMQEAEQSKRKIPEE